MPKRAGGPSIRIGSSLRGRGCLPFHLASSCCPCASRWKTRAPALSPGDNVSGGASPPFNGGSADWRDLHLSVRPVFPGQVSLRRSLRSAATGLNSGVFVITPNGGLLPPSVRVTLDDLARLAKTDIDPSAKEFRKPLQKDAKALAQALGPRGEPILLGSIATRKYLDVLLAAFPQELLFPSEFVGRGDMSRGGLMLRSADAHLELTYVPVRGAILRGARPPKLPPRSTRS